MNVPFLLCFTLYLRRGGAYIWRGDLTERFLRYRFGGLIFGGALHGGAYFRNFTVGLTYLTFMPRKNNLSLLFMLGTAKRNLATT